MFLSIQIYSFESTKSSVGAPVKLIQRRFIVLVVWAVVLGPALLGAEDDPDAAAPLVTDRPDQTESAAVVAAGLVQVEAGFTHVEDEPDGGDLVVADGIGETLVRIGLVRGLELRLGFAGYRLEELDTATGETSDEGYGGATLGAKLGLLEERGARPRVALIAGTTIPSGARRFSTDDFDPFVRATASHTLSERLSLGYNLGAAWLTEEDDAGDEDTLSVLLGTVTCGIALSERVATFVELFGESGLSAEDDFTAADAGATWLVLDNLQLDLSGGIGLSESAADWFGGVGVSFRLPR